MHKKAIYRCLATILWGAIIFAASSVSAANLSQQYNIFGSVTPTTAYNFGIAQYRLFANEILDNNTSLYFDYDTDAFYLQFDITFLRYLKSGVYGKTHIFDYQNANHLINPATGEDQPEFTIKASHLMGGGYWGAFSPQGYFIRAGAEAEKTNIALRDKSALTVSAVSPGIAISGTGSLGLNKAIYIKPWFTKGYHAAVNYKYRTFESTYEWKANGNNLSSPSRVISEGELIGGYGYYHDTIGIMTNIRAGLQNLAFSGATPDLLYAYSLGGPELRYRRIAGFAFSEYRNPAFVLVNNDFYYNFFSTMHLWLVADMLFLDRETAGKSFHAGTGAGLVYDLPRNFLEGYNSFFVRVDFALTAGRNALSDRLQVLFGLTGHF